MSLWNFFSQVKFIKYLYVDGLRYHGLKAIMRKLMFKKVAQLKS